MGIPSVWIETKQRKRFTGRFDSAPTLMEKKEEKQKEGKILKMRIELKEGQTIQDLYDLRLWIWAKAERMGFNVLDKNTSLE